MSDESSIQQLPAADPAELRLLEQIEVRFRWEQSRLQLQYQGSEWQHVNLLRAYPLSEPESWISVLNAENKEIGMLRELRGLDQESLACAREELSRRYLIPQIQRILSTRTRADLVEWTVDTDRGRITFLIRSAQDHIKHAPPRRLMFTDVEGNRFDIPDIDTLDDDSRKRLDEYV